jgi:hypothetical protein
MFQTFEQELYDAVGRAFPGLTVRSMSRLLGKSSGYWSSMTSQKLPLPIDTLMHLADVVECRRILLPQGSRRACQLESVQGLLCEEISTRLAATRAYLEYDFAPSGEKLTGETAPPTLNREPMPFFVSRY